LRELPRFHIASDEEIKKGDTTDIYFVRTEEILRAKGLDSTRIVAEVTVGALPRNWSWAVLTGIEEEAHLLNGLPVDVDAMPEGTVFHPRDIKGVRLPVMHITGAYASFCRYETALLGLLCQSSGIATAAAKVRKAARTKHVINFGARRMHPSLSPLIGRSAYIGGLDGVSSLAAAKLIGVPPTGTMPHSLIIVYGDQIKAWKAFDEIISPDVPRVALVDTYYDEKAEAVMAAEALYDRIWGVRLDTPGSRRGDFAEIVREVRWELDIRGYAKVKIFVSGGLNPRSIHALSTAGADGFGVGTWISNTPAVDFAMDIVEIDGKPVAKRGKLGGKKQVWRCGTCFIDRVLPSTAPEPTCPQCKGATEPMLKPLIRNGEIVEKLPALSEIRESVRNSLEKVILEDIS
jgi:nicotinate phosphoribosyltransferase